MLDGRLAWGPNCDGTFACIFETHGLSIVAVQFTGICTGTTAFSQDRLESTKNLYSVNLDEGKTLSAYTV